MRAGIVLIELYELRPEAVPLLRRFDDERVQHHHLLRRGVKRPVCSCVAFHLRLIDTRGGDDRAVLLHDEEVVRIERLACSFLGGIDAANPADGRLAALFEVVCMVINGSDRGNVHLSCFSECRHEKNFFLLRFLHATTRGASCQSLTGTAADGIIAPERRWLDGTANTAPAARPWRNRTQRRSMNWRRIRTSARRPAGTSIRT